MTGERTGRQLPVYVHGQLFVGEGAELARELALDRGGRALETIALRGKGLLFLEAHLERLARTCRALALPFDDPAAVRERVLSYAGRIPGDALVRLTFGEDLTLTARPLPEPPSEVAVWPSREPVVLGEAGRHKTTSRLPYDLLQRAARERGAHEGLFVDADGRLLEGSVTSFFGVRAGVLRTAPTEAGVLGGILRRMVLEAARELDLEVQLGPIRRDELDRLSEAFLTSAGVRVLPVARFVDPEIALGSPGPVSRALAERICTMEARDRTETNT